MVDPDIQIEAGGGGGGGSHPDPEIRRRPGLQKIFFRPFGPQFGLKIRGAAKSATAASYVDLGANSE